MFRNSNLGTSDKVRYGDFKVYLGDEILGKYEAVNFFADFWAGLDYPRRRDIHPAAFKAYLNRIVILDVDKPDGKLALTIRLIGTFVADYYGEISGRDVNVMSNKRAVERIYEACRLVLEREQPLLTITPALSEDKKHLEAIAFYMPLYDDEKNITKILTYVDVLSVDERALKRLAEKPQEWNLL